MNQWIIFSTVSGELLIISLEIQSYPSDLFVFRFCIIFLNSFFEYDLFKAAPGGTL